MWATWALVLDSPGWVQQFQGPCAHVRYTSALNGFVSRNGVGYVHSLKDPLLLSQMDGNGASRVNGKPWLLAVWLGSDAVKRHNTWQVKMMLKVEQLQRSGWKDSFKT